MSAVEEQFYERMETEIHRYKQRYPSAQWVGVADRAHDQWAWLEQWTQQSILDFWHAAGYLEKAASGVCPSKTDRVPWFEQSRHRLKEKAGGAKELLAEMKDALAHRKPRGAALQDLNDAISYFVNVRRSRRPTAARRGVKRGERTGGIERR